MDAFAGSADRSPTSLSVIRLLSPTENLRLVEQSKDALVDEVRRLAAISGLVCVDAGVLRLWRWRRTAEAA
jgi:hypothetical protein